MAKNFEKWFSLLKDTNIKPSFYYTDYIKVQENLDKFKDILIRLGNVSSKHEFVKKCGIEFDRDKTFINIIPMFTALRSDKVVIKDGDDKAIKWNHLNVTFNESMKFLEEVGFLKRIEENGPINLLSYFYGINVGLDSNGRKNRSGKQMENLVLSYIKPLTDNFISQATSKKIKEKWEVEIETKFKKNKRFDFAIMLKNGKILLIETNFFNTSGSKSNINAAFIPWDDEFSENKSIYYCVITDGYGLKKAKEEIEDVYKNIELVWNINDLKNNVLKKLFNNNK